MELGYGSGIPEVVPSFRFKVSSFKLKIAVLFAVLCSRQAGALVNGHDNLKMN